ncbi:MAG: hypothetical protein HY542_02870 [Deltaproteobacteria bacterium]|nr:hypothetical protein [Deltaproteobacteria bacterium]
MHKFFLFLLCACLVMGCQKAELHHGLTEIEADEIINLLHQNLIEAEKRREVSGQEVSWLVAVSKVTLPEARKILISNNFPRHRELGLSGVYKDKGLIPTPDEQKARFLLATKGEIINSLEKIPGVVDADVVLNIPDENEFAEIESLDKRPTASVIMRVRFNEDLSLTEGKVQRFVANAVPKLNPNDVAVIISRAGGPSAASTTLLPPSVSPPFTGSASPSASGTEIGFVELAGMRVDEESVGRLKLFFIVLLLLLMIISGILLVMVVRFNRLRVRLQTGAPVDAVPVGGGEQQLLGGGEGAGTEGTFDVGRRGG